MFESIINDSVGITLNTVLACSLASIFFGLIIAYIYMRSGRYSKNFVISLAILPILVQIVIMMVNGNLGTSVAILGAFGLVRFRSLPGTSKEIVAIFFAMAVGLATGIGYIGFAALFLVLVGILLLVLSISGFGEKNQVCRELKITIPENLDYTEIFDDIFNLYTDKACLEQVKTTNLGSLYELQYHIVLKKAKEEKNMIDEIRCRNGNLTIISRRECEGRGEL